MEEYRTRHATAGQVGELWLVIAAMKEEIERLTQRLSQVEGIDGSSTGASHVGADGTGSP